LNKFLKKIILKKISASLQTWNLWSISKTQKFREVFNKIFEEL
jgi:hypothetical protein